MKLKEIPGYLFRAWELKSIALDLLQQERASKHQNTIISLTSIEPRISSLHLVIRSLISQSVAAEKVVLWLHSDLKHKLPVSLTSLEGCNFAIYFCEESCPHRKLVEPLKNENFANKTIVTCDDDMLYPKDWLQRLLDEHKKTPDQIVAHECRKILYAANGDILPYTKWIKETPGESHWDTISIGYGGVLYPSGSLPSMSTDSSLYMALAPRGDDLWFKAMSMIAGTKIRRTHTCEPMPIPILGSQKVALKRANIKQDENRQQWENIINHFNFKSD